MSEAGVNVDKACENMLIELWITTEPGVDKWINRLNCIFNPHNILTYSRID